MQITEQRPDLKIILVDLPGFGLSEIEQNVGWDTYKYAHWLIDFMTILNLPKANFYTHSFGGRVIVRLLETQPQKVEKLILTAAAGIKWPLSPLQKGSQMVSKIIPKFKRGPLAKIRNFIVTKILKAHDWHKAKPEIKATLKKILQEPDVRDLLVNFTQPTLILWGAKDSYTPLKSGHIFAQNLPNNTYHVFQDGRHGIHHTHTKEISNLVTNFI